MTGNKRVNKPVIDLRDVFSNCDSGQWRWIPFLGHNKSPLVTDERPAERRDGAEVSLKTLRSLCGREAEEAGILRHIRGLSLEK